MARQEKFTGKQRRYQTRGHVKIADLAARVSITLGGIGTILAVIGVFVFLSYVVVPLFLPEKITPLKKLSTIRSDLHQPGNLLATDEHLVMGWIAEQNGSRLVSFRLDTGEVLDRVELFAGETPLALNYLAREQLLVAAFADGRILLGQIQFDTRFLHSEDLPSKVETLQPGERAAFDGGIVERTPMGQLRLQKLAVSFEPPIESGVSDIILIDVSRRPGGPVISFLSADGSLHIKSLTSRRNLLTGETITTLAGGSMQMPHVEAGLPSYLLLSGVADNVFVVWEDGYLVRVDARDLVAPVVAEERRLLEEGGRLTSFSYLIGKTTLVTGDSLGRIQTWFRIKPQDAATVDGALLVMTHDLGQGPAEVTSLAPSLRRRVLAAGFADGTTRLFHVTSDQLLSEEKVGEGPVISLALAPKDNAFAALSASGLGLWSIDAPHPETTWTALFGKKHYEGMEDARHVWQSSSATDDFEPKYGLIPLVFGTLKATFYSMLFGAPLALLAAIYTSEFLVGPLRSRIKPVVEMMASLPSVVLGFIAALVVAPFVENLVPNVLAAFFTIPLAFVASAYLFQMLPAHLFVRWSRWQFPLLFCIALPGGIILANLAGPLMEWLLFAGDIKGWLNGRIGTGTGGWVLMLLPLSGILVALITSRFITPRLRNFTLQHSRGQAGLMEMTKFLLGLIATALLAWLLAGLLNGLGFDSRADFPLIGPVLDTYVQRNALVVGFIMGFAIIPIIYTLAEDALSSVPEHLRSASLASGATPWQTAVRIIIPTAASGLFSAVMIGLGRAVGETMIVLMAAGNTPVLEWNIFNGFRTLSANIAVELPEAVVWGTHFRVLFLAALTLFMMTFVVNTLAEVVRLRFRKRAYQL
ncbi:ABC transporter permease subunit [Geoalkalibacter sp.]|uniref:ABC transporter permease subunit n=1 Tax=Geoalkalibacter sp. TaxID=3041440 RepID=UPI00272DEB44|nr:ABC transporter permease subunit [Geoalkalibacter sp.]